LERIRLAEKRKLQLEEAKKKKSRPRGGPIEGFSSFFFSFFFFPFPFFSKNEYLDDSRNVMDDLIATIRSGAVFDRSEEKESKAKASRRTTVTDRKASSEKSGEKKSEKKKGYNLLIY